MTTLQPQIVTTREPLWFLGTLVRPTLTGAQTGGRFGLWEAVLPRDAAPPLHTHPQDETFYVLEGKVSTWVGDGRFDCEPGAAVFVPGGTPHAFRVESESARLLFISTPAGIEDWLLELSEPAGWPWLPPPPDGPRVPPERLAVVERKHGVIRVGPPPAAANEKEGQ